MMFKEFIHLFRKPSARVIAQEEYEEAQRQLLKAHAHSEYYARMVQYYSDQERRLGNYLKREEER